MAGSTSVLSWRPRARGVAKSQEMPPCFKKADWPLQAFRLEEYRGFLFVTSSVEAPPLRDALGNVELALGDWPLEELVTVCRREYVVECNWKFLMENTSETYHTSIVHKDSLGPMPSCPIAEFRGVQPQGDWDAVHVPGERSIVPLPGEAAPFPEMPSVPPEASTFFVSIFPTLQLNVTRDCAWWMRVLPEGPTTSRVTQGFLFPPSTVAMPGFATLLEPYLHRWDLAVSEDNEISVNQQRATANPMHRPGPYHPLEFSVHRFDNMVLDAVLGAGDPRPALDTPGAADPRSRPVHGATAPASLALSAARHRPPPAATAARAIGSAASAIAEPFSLSPGARVCVTGATGFIALHLVEQLLSKGFRVTAAVRSDSAQKLEPLMALGALGELEVVSGCDLLEPGSFDAAVSGAEVCFHTASPFWMDARVTDPWAQLVRPAEAGTVNVLDACAAASSTVRRVVLTSSFAAAMNVGGRTPWAMDFEYTEEHWNTSSAPDAAGEFPEPVNGHAYRWSKTAAERAAWDHPATGTKFDLVTIMPPMVLGENKQHIRSLTDLNQSSLLLYNLLAGITPHVMPGSVGFVDVADVATAHVLAAQTPSAGGERYMCSGETRTWLHVVSLLRSIFPSAPLPTACADGSTTQPCLMLRNDKIRRDLGIEFTPLERTLRKQGDALARSGLISL